MAANRAPENPYLAARQEWSERYGSYVKAAAAWRIVGVLGLVMAVIGFSYAMYLSTQVRLVPYIVEVDKLGTAVTAGFPEQIEYADVRVVRHAGNFVTSFRSITPDAVVQKQYIDRTYALLRRPIRRRRRSTPRFEAILHSRRRSPRRLPSRSTTSWRFQNQTYQIDWTEYERDRKGKGNRHTPVPWHRNGDAHRATG
ncbi:VirB8/TrbF family protein [Rhizobium beringeri]